LSKTTLLHGLDHGDDDDDCGGGGGEDDDDDIVSVRVIIN